MKSRLSLTSFVFGLLAVTAIIYVVPIFYTNYNVFSLLERGAAEQAVSGLTRTAALGFLFVLVTLTGVFLIATVLLLQLVILPIKKLERGFTELRNGNLGVSLEPEGLAEISRIADDFNEATRTVCEQTKALAAAKSELQKVNERLEAEYAEAKKLNDLTVNRELVMVKMKEELARLKTALGNDGATR